MLIICFDHNEVDLAQIKAKQLGQRCGEMMVGEGGLLNRNWNGVESVQTKHMTNANNDYTTRPKI